MDQEAQEVIIGMLADLKQVTAVVAGLADGSSQGCELCMLVLHLCDVRERWVMEAQKLSGAGCSGFSIVKH